MSDIEKRLDRMQEEINKLRERVAVLEHKTRTTGYINIEKPTVGSPSPWPHQQSPFNPQLTPMYDTRHTVRVGGWAATCDSNLQNKD